MPTLPQQTSEPDGTELQTVLQFKVTLLHISPAIWRRIVVPEEYTFWDLHVAIQDSMGWLDYHLHRFVATDIDGSKVEIGVPDEDDELLGIETHPDWEILLPEVFLDPGDRAAYIYDFGDNWLHEVLLEGIFLAEEGKDYPRCIGGERACPPEDCGSVPGYFRLLEALEDKKHKEHKEMVGWLKGHAKNYYPYNPDRFVQEEVKFSNPQERWSENFEFVEDLDGH